MTRSVILLSGGLDSVVSLALCREKYNIVFALTFDYGQKSAKQEIEASKKIAGYYGVEHKVIKLDWLKEITHTSIVEDKEIPSGIQTSAKSVWVPNRNGLFLNIAGSFADGEDYDYIIIGANKEEAANFPDNTAEFIARINSEFEYSTQKHPEVLAPLINFDKNDIVKQALINSVPLEFVRSCYQGFEKHCGRCESCTRLKKALIANNDVKYTKILFED